MKTVTCIKNIKSKKGFEFNNGEQYSFTINNNSIRIYFDNNNSVVIKNEKTLNRYFK